MRRIRKIALIIIEILICTGLSALTLHICCRIMSHAFITGNILEILLWMPMVAVNAGFVALVARGFEKLIDKESKK